MCVAVARIRVLCVCAAVDQDRDWRMHTRVTLAQDLCVWAVVSHDLDANACMVVSGYQFLYSHVMLIQYSTVVHAWDSWLCADFCHTLDMAVVHDGSLYVHVAVVCDRGIYVCVRVPVI